MTGPIVELERVSKTFGGVKALQDVSLTILPGEVHALVGENGAGKSTLGKLIAGVHSADGGLMRVHGREVRYHSPYDTLKDGIAIVAQEIALVPQRTVLENTFLGLEKGRLGFPNNRALRERYKDLVQSTGLDVPWNARVSSLRIADQQKVEILRAVARDARVIVMDEPTAALTREEAGQLLEIVKRLRDGGTSIVYVSHFLEELLQISDRVTILKDGKFVRTGCAANETPDSLVTSMLGAVTDLSLSQVRPVREDAPTVLRVRDLANEPMVNGVSFSIRAGEIVGLTGLVGSGRTEVARMVFGADRFTRGEIEFLGQRRRWRSPTDAVRAGVAMLPEDRKEQGLVLNQSVGDNVLLAQRGAVSHYGFVRKKQEKAVADQVLSDVTATSGRLDVPVSTLSGGNQQKVALGKWLVRPPKLLIIDEPTRGVDIGAKHAIYELLTRCASEGMAMLVISSEVEEVLGLAHRIIVMRRGCVAADIDAANTNEEVIMSYMLGSEVNA